MWSATENRRPNLAMLSAITPYEISDRVNQRTGSLVHANNTPRHAKSSCPTLCRRDDDSSLGNWTTVHPVVRFDAESIRQRFEFFIALRKRERCVHLDFLHM